MSPPFSKNRKRFASNRYLPTSISFYSYSPSPLSSFSTLPISTNFSLERSSKINIEKRAQIEAETSDTITTLTTADSN